MSNSNTVELFVPSPRGGSGNGGDTDGKRGKKKKKKGDAHDALINEDAFFGDTVLMAAEWLEEESDDKIGNMGLLNRMRERKAFKYNRKGLAVLFLFLIAIAPTLLMYSRSFCRTIRESSIPLSLFYLPMTIFVAFLILGGVWPRFPATRFVEFLGLIAHDPGFLVTSASSSSVFAKRRILVANRFLLALFSLCLFQFIYSAIITFALLGYPPITGFGSSPEHIMYDRAIDEDVDVNFFRRWAGCEARGWTPARCILVSGILVEPIYLLYWVFPLSIVTIAVGMSWSPSEDEVKARTIRYEYLCSRRPLLAELFEAIETEAEKETMDVGRWDKLSSPRMLMRLTILIITFLNVFTVIGVYYDLEQSLGTSLLSAGHYILAIILLMPMNIAVGLSGVFCVDLSLDFFNRNLYRMRAMTTLLEKILRDGASAGEVKRLLNMRLIYDGEILELDYQAPSFIVTGLVVLSVIVSILSFVWLFFYGFTFNWIPITLVPIAAILASIAILSVSVQVVLEQDLHRKLLDGVRLAVSQSVVGLESDNTHHVSFQSFLQEFTSHVDKYRPYASMLGIPVKPTILKLLVGYAATAVIAIGSRLAVTRPQE